MQDKWLRALRYLERSEAIFKDTGNDYELAKICIALGWAHTQQGDFYKSLEYRLEGYRLAQRHRVMGQQPDDYLRMQSHVYLGLSLHQTGFLDQAQKQLEAAKTISDRLEEMHERSTILVGLAQVYFDKYIAPAKKKRTISPLPTITLISLPPKRKRSGISTAMPDKALSGATLPEPRKGRPGH